MVTSTTELTLRFPKNTLGNLYISPRSFPHGRSWAGQASGEVRITVGEHQILGLAMANDIDLKTLEGLEAMQHITSMDLSTTNYSANLLAGIIKITKLVELRLDFLKLTSQDFVNLNECSTLKSIWLTGSSTEDDFLPLLKGVPSLENIVLKSTTVSDKGMAALAALPNLQTLHLPSAIGDAGVEALSKSTSLADLDLSYCKISGKAIESLASLNTLHTLYVNDTGLGDDSAPEFKKIKALKVLFLNGTKLTDKCLEHLALDNLEHLELRDAKATEIGIARLRSKLNNCAVFGP